MCAETAPTGHEGEKSGETFTGAERLSKADAERYRQLREIRSAIQEKRQDLCDLKLAAKRILWARGVKEQFPADAEEAGELEKDLLAYLKENIFGDNTELYDHFVAHLPQIAEGDENDDMIEAFQAEIKAMEEQLQTEDTELASAGGEEGGVAPPSAAKSSSLKTSGTKAANPVASGSSMGVSAISSSTSDGHASALKTQGGEKAPYYELPPQEAPTQAQPPSR